MKLTAFGRQSFLVSLAAAGIFALGLLPAIASPRADDNAPPDAAPASPGGRSVRLSSVEGGVRVVLDGEVVADPALVNQPLFEGSQIMTANDGQAEIQLEDGSVARLSPNTTLTFSVMQAQGTSTKTEIVVNAGLAYFELQPSNADHSLRVNYGRTSFAASSFTVARVLADQMPGELAVFSGNIHLERGNALQLDLHGGESLNLNAADGNGYDIAESIEPNSWDSWNSDRDELLNAESAEKTQASSNFANNQGMSDLDANGSWYDVPGQGYVWSPYDAQAAGASWDPYGFGHWVYYPRYGYLWVSGYGWGYAPYRCGLWNFYDGFGWGWAPGGGCNSWGYGYGFYGGGGGWYNIGNHPRGYQPPRRPTPGPIHPRPGPGPRPGQHGGVGVVAVDRRQPGVGNVASGSHGSEPVVIAGHVVEPLRPVAPVRTPYDRNGFATPGGARSGYQPVYPGSRPGVVSGYPGGARPGMPQQGGRPTNQPSYRPQPSQPSRSAPAPAPRPSSGGGGGGGGGGSHPSGGSPHK
jgi:hypothetical protein